MQRLFKDYSGVPNIKSLKVKPYDPHTNKFSYPPDREESIPSGFTYGTCDPELDAMELQL